MAKRRHRDLEERVTQLRKNVETMEQLALREAEYVNTFHSSILKSTTWGLSVFYVTCICIWWFEMYRYLVRAIASAFDGPIEKFFL